MGEGSKSKRKAKGAGASDRQAVTPTAATLPAAPAPGSSSLLEHEGRQRARAAIVSELLDYDPGDTRAKVLATALKGINDYERAEIRRQEDELDAAAVRELAEIKRQKARTRSGVVRSDEAPKLPLAGNPGPH